MNILASELKHVLKRLAPLKAETYQIGENGLSAQDPSEVWVVCASSLSELGKTLSFSGKKFSQVITRMSGELDITTEENKLIIKSYKAKVELETRAVSKPVLPAPAEKYVTLKLAELKSALVIATASASPKKSEAFGGVVLLQSLLTPVFEEGVTPTGYRVVGTDSLILTVVQRDLPVPFEFKYPLNLTAAAIVQFMDEDTIEIGETATHLILKSGADTVYAAKPSKTYPEFGKIISAKHPVTLQIPSEKWIPALRTVETLIDEEKDSGNISLHFKDGVVQFSTIGIGSTASDEAEYEQIDPDPVFDPKEFRMKVKAKYLSGFLAKAGPVATISVTSSKVPIRYESGQVVAFTTLAAEKEEK
jgi:DNA polymerase III sliding clamp (beta) subunit (PCNA family)